MLIHPHDVLLKYTVKSAKLLLTKSSPKLLETSQRERLLSFLEDAYY